MRRKGIGALLSESARRQSALSSVSGRLWKVIGFTAEESLTLYILREVSLATWILISAHTRKWAVGDDAMPLTFHRGN